MPQMREQEGVLRPGQCLRGDLQEKLTIRYPLSRLFSRTSEGNRLIIFVAATEKASYVAVWRGQNSWNGVAILAHDCEPVVTHTTLPGDTADSQRRYIEAAVNGVLFGTLYASNGNPRPEPKFNLA